ncbi:MAG: hypothetical protein J1F18_03840 [Lachnospiraceae bacterium]|nr:hypothetical protein [Lachnospiraceae bacterium]
MKKTEYKHIGGFENRKNLLMFIQTFEEVLFYYSFESYKLPALNSHFLCFDILQTKYNIDHRSITEGNFIPLSEEFEATLTDDIVLKRFLPEVDMLLSKRDKLNNLIDYTKMDYKAKIGKYTEAAEYIKEISEANSIYLQTVFNLLMDKIFAEECNFETLKTIYSLTRTLATELVNGGYSSEYISQELKNFFLNNKNAVKGDKQEVIDFFNKFSFEKKSYQVLFGINAGSAAILKHIKDVNVKKPSRELRKALNLKHEGDCIVELFVEDVDRYEAVDRAYGYINTIAGLHRISQHHKPIYIKPIAQINQVNEELNLISSNVVKIGKNVLLRANNESQIQSYFFDDQLLNNVAPPDSFFRAVSLHNNALDSKEPTNQLLDLWTAIETLVGFRTGDEDKINVVCNILTSVLNRTYIFSHIEQLYKDILAILGTKSNAIFDEIGGDEQNIMKLTKVLAINDYQEYYNKLFGMLEDYPILQYRLELFANHIFCNSKTVFDELVRHKHKLKWQIMRIYRNRNMIVHNGEYMPYLNVILENLHYYVDTMFDVLIEYYHMGVENNKIIFYNIEKEEMLYWEILGLDEKGKKVDIKEITEENYKQIIFNEYEGNVVKNVVRQAIEEMRKKKGETEGNGN